MDITKSDLVMQWLLFPLQTGIWSERWLALARERAGLISVVSVASLRENLSGFSWLHLGKERPRQCSQFQGLPTTIWHHFPSCLIICREDCLNHSCKEYRSQVVRSSSTMFSYSLHILHPLSLPPLPNLLLLTFLISYHSSPPHVSFNHSIRFSFCYPTNHSQMSEFGIIDLSGFASKKGFPSHRICEGPSIFQLVVRCLGHVLTFLFMRFFLVWACLALMHAVAITVSFYFQQLCCILDVNSHCGIHSSQRSVNFGLGVLLFLC